MFEKRKGISTFIATLLLMVLAVSAGVVIYAYTMGYMGGFGGTDTLGAMALDEGDMHATIVNVGDDDLGTINVYVRNIGKTAIALDTVYVDGVECVISSVEVDGSAVDAIPEAEVGEIELTHIIEEVVWDAGKTYVIKLIAQDNTQLSFNLKCKEAISP